MGGLSKFKPKLDILPTPQLDLWPDLTQVPRHFVLYGGTAIALHLGHRQSVDFDFFSEEPLDGRSKERLRSLPFMASFKPLQDEPDTLAGLVQRAGGSVKVSFFGNIRNGRVNEPETTDDNVLLVASLGDLLGHKLKVIHDRAEGKDYQDIATILMSGMSLESGVSVALALFGENFPIAPTLKGLTYFDDLNEGWRVTDAMKAAFTSAIQSFPSKVTPASLVSFTPTGNEGGSGMRL